MESIGFLSNFVVAGAEVVGLVVLSVVVVLFLTQLCYYLSRYGRVVVHRNATPSEQAERTGVSVVVPLFDADFGFLAERLPRLLDQKHALYEVVVVDVTGSDEFADRLKLLKITNPRLATTRLKVDPLYPITTKMALNVGIKAAHYDNVVFTLPDCAPVSARWADVYARSFVGHQVVLGYASMSAARGLGNRFLRCANFATGMRYLSAAVGSRPYRGTLCNMGFTKEAYFAAKGFNYLSLNMGEDDLFVAKIANADNTAVVMGRAAMVEQKSWGGLGWWTERRIRLSYTFRHYSARVRWSTSWELWSRAVWFGVAAYALCGLPMAGQILVASLVVVRLAVVLLMASRASRRLGEHGIVATYVLYDLLSPIGEAVLSVCRTLRPRPGRR